MGVTMGLFGPKKARHAKEKTASFKKCEQKDCPENHFYLHPLRPQFKKPRRKRKMFFPDVRSHTSTKQVEQV